MNRLARTIPAGLLATFVVCYPLGQFHASEKAELRKVTQAIDSIRGHDVRSQSARESQKLDVRLDKAWETLHKYPETARRMVLELLNGEVADDFLVIDLSHFLLTLDDDDETVSQVASWVSTANPAVYPSAYFYVAAALVTRRCDSCLPAAVRLLELDALEAGFEEHALSVDLGLGLLFAVGAWGDVAISSLEHMLSNEQCTVRSNAAYLLGVLLPEVTPAGLGHMAANDDCLAARNAAWRSLSRLKDPSLVTLVSARMEMEPPVDEILVLIDAIQAQFDQPSLDLVQKLASDGDPRVRKVAEELEENLSASNEHRAELVRNLGSADDSVRSKVQRALERAVDLGILDFDGTAFELESGLKSTDLQLLNEARASVLRRQSDECLYDWKKLFLAAAVVRHVAARQ